MGLVGLGLYVWLLVSGMRSASLARRVSAGTADAAGAWLALAILVSILAVALHGVLDNTGWHDRVFYVLLALATAVRGLAAAAPVPADEGRQ